MGVNHPARRSTITERISIPIQCLGTDTKQSGRHSSDLSMPCGLWGRDPNGPTPNGPTLLSGVEAIAIYIGSAPRVNMSMA
jgi:hypothetical protein